jgi:hypothetical protein
MKIPISCHTDGGRNQIEGMSLRGARVGRRSNPVYKIPISSHCREGGDSMTRIAISSHCEGGGPKQSSNEKRIRLAALGLAMTRGLSPGKSGAAPLRDTLTSKLSQYCIPKDTAGCGVLRAKYQNSACYCGNTTYMYYDATARTCRPKCPAGQIPEETSGGCQAGYGGLVVKENYF